MLPLSNRFTIFNKTKDKIDKNDYEWIKYNIDIKKHLNPNSLVYYDDRLYSLFSYAILKGNNDLAKKLLNDYNVILYTKEEFRNYYEDIMEPLNAAILGNNHEMIDLIYDYYRKNDIDISTLDVKSITSIQYSILSGQFNTFKKILDLYLENDIDIKNIIDDIFYKKFVRDDDSYLTSLHYILYYDLKDVFDYILDNYYDDIKSILKDSIVYNGGNILNSAIIYGNTYYVDKIYKIYNDISQNLDKRKSMDKMIYKFATEKLLDDISLYKTYIMNSEVLDYLFDNYKTFYLSKENLSEVFKESLTKNDRDTFFKIIDIDSDILDSKIDDKYPIYWLLSSKTEKDTDIIDIIISKVDDEIIKEYSNGELVNIGFHYQTDPELMDRILDMGFLILNKNVNDIEHDEKMMEYMLLLNKYRYQTVDDYDIFYDVIPIFINKFGNYDEVEDWDIYKDIQYLKLFNRHDDQLDELIIDRMLDVAYRYGDIRGMSLLLNIIMNNIKYKDIDIDSNYLKLLSENIDNYIDKNAIKNISDKDRFEVLKRFKNSKRPIYSEYPDNKNGFVDILSIGRSLSYNKIMDIDISI